jgi:hypothetical protein
LVFTKNISIQQPAPKTATVTSDYVLLYLRFIIKIDIGEMVMGLLWALELKSLKEKENDIFREGKYHYLNPEPVQRTHHLLPLQNKSVFVKIS